MLVTVKHNIEVAHRLSQTPGKCEAIHGHSMIVTLNIMGAQIINGMLEGLDFSGIKERFRGYLDTQYDHRLLLNGNDPLIAALSGGKVNDRYPGLNQTVGDPSTENLAADIGLWAEKVWMRPVLVEVQETAVNAASYASVGFSWGGRRV